MGVHIHPWSTVDEPIEMNRKTGGQSRTAPPNLTAARPHLCEEVHCMPVRVPAAERPITPTHPLDVRTTGSGHTP